MPVARVLIVDDSVLVRKVLTTALDGQAELEVVGTASSGRLGLQRIALLAPDVVVLDVEMPELDGIATLREIVRLHPGTRVIMFSTVTEHGAQTTLDALEIGASDYLPKPAGKSTVEESIDYVRRELVPRIRAVMSSRNVDPDSLRPSSLRESDRRLVVERRPAPPRVLAIGSSTGGPNALAELLRQLPPSFPLPIVVTQHMPPVFTRLLAERLAAQVGLPVSEASEGMALEPGKVLIAPGDHHLTFRKRLGGRVEAVLSREPPENSCRPSVDPMLRSLVDTFDAGVLAVILTGMGRDGSSGAQEVVRAGGAVLCQDEASSVVWGMPGFIAKAGLAERVVPLLEMGAEILRRTRAYADEKLTEVRA